MVGDGDWDIRKCNNGGGTKQEIGEEEISFNFYFRCCSFEEGIGDFVIDGTKEDYNSSIGADCWLSSRAIQL